MYASLRRATARALAWYDAAYASRPLATAFCTCALKAAASDVVAQRQLEGVLSSTQGGLFTDPGAARRKEVAERDKLVHVVNRQARDIEALKKEISMLRVKGGQVYG